MPSATRLSRSAIIDAAEQVLDEVGLDVFGMRAVAERLGTGHASLYRHVASRPELLDLVLERTLAAIPLPRDTDCRGALESLARGMRRTLLGARDRARIALISRTPTPSTAAIADLALHALLSAGLPPRDAVLVVDRLSLYVLTDAATTASSADDSTDGDDAWSDVAQDFAAFDADAYPALARVGPLLAEPDADERFEFGLALLFDAVAERVPIQPD